MSKAPGISSGERLRGDEPVFRGGPRFELVQARDAERLVAEVDSKRLRSARRHRLGQDAAAASDVDDALAFEPAAVRSIQSRRSGFILCNGPNIALSGSHH